jgi:hypothetical protein
MAGELSPDGNYYWDGVRWTLATSPDGAWRWDGRSWKPARRSGGGISGGVAALIAAGVIVVLVITGVGLFAFARLVNNAQQSLVSHLGPACTATGMAGGAVAEGTTVCGRKLGASLVSLDCTSASSLPSSLVAEESASANADWTPADVGMDQQGCEMVAQPDEDLAIDSADDAPPQLVVIADFVPADARGGIGLRLGCTQDGSCIDISLYADDESFSLDEGTPGADTWKNLKSGPLVLAYIHFNKPNRVILRYVDGVASVFLNGYSVTDATPDIAQGSGSFGFYVDDQQASSAEHVQLRNLYAFQAL